jgi:hypothetical protein
METGQLIHEVVKLRQKLRWHRDQQDNDRCHENDNDLYRLLPDKGELPTNEVSPGCVFLDNCVAYYNQQSGRNESWLLLRTDAHLQRYLQTWDAYRQKIAQLGFDESVDDDELVATISSLRVAFHMLSIDQKKAVFRLGLFSTTAGSVQGIV